MERARVPCRGPWPASAAALVGWVTLFWLSRRPLAAGTLGLPLDPWASLALALLVAWLAPGFFLWRLLGRRRGWLEDAAFSFGLGLSYLLLLASLVLMAHSSIDVFTASATAGAGVLALASVTLALRTPRAPPALPPGPRPLIAAGLAAVLAVLLAVSGSARGFTFGGDEWFHMRAARQFLEATSISDTMMLDSWSLVLALIVKLAGVDLVEAYRVLLVPFLIGGAALCYLALARQVLRSWRSVSLAFALQALYCLSDMHTRGEGAGMALLARIAEDKYAGLLIAVPLALAALLGFLRSGRPGLAAVFAVMGVTATILQPLALFWIGLPAAGLLAVALARRPVGHRRWAAVAAAAGVAALTLVLAWVQRSLRPAQAFVLHAPDWPFNAQLLALSRRQLLILSGERGWIMAHGALLLHPLMLGALLATLRLVPRFRRSLSARFLVLAMVLPMALAYNPLSATWLGSWIMPWMVYRLLWSMPVTLVLAALLAEALAALEGWWRCRRVAAPSAAAGLLTLAVMAALLGPRIGQGLEALRARNRVFVSAGERELMQFLSGQPLLRGMVLAPRAVSVHLPAWSSRLQACPGPDAVRSPGEHVQELRDCRRLLKAPVVDDRFVCLMLRRGIDYVIAPRASALDRALASLAAFQPLYHGSEYSFYAWRPQRWERFDILVGLAVCRMIPADAGGGPAPALPPDPSGASSPGAGALGSRH